MMSDSKNSIKLTYLYRDAGNYKVFGSVVFSNPDGIAIAKIEAQIRSVLIDGEFFEPLKWGIKPLAFDESNDELDHSWNEFVSVHETADPPSTSMTVSSFLEKLTVLQLR
jgi:hypothetical protein